MYRFFCILTVLRTQWTLFLLTRHKLDDLFPDYVCGVRRHCPSARKTVTNVISVRTDSLQPFPVNGKRHSSK